MDDIVLKTPVWIDTSFWDAGMNFKALNPKPWLILTKASEGEQIIDPTFFDFFPEIKIQGIRRGSFHFLRPGDIGNQADLYIDLNRAAGYTAGDILCLDAEDARNTMTQIKQWLDHVERELGARPIIYSSAEIIKNILHGAPAPEWFDDYFWWLAGYPDFPNLFESIPAAYLPQGVTLLNVAGWQYTDKKIYVGMPGETDVNWINPIWAARINLQAPTQGESMFKYQITPKFSNGSRVRQDHAQNSIQIDALSFGRFAFGNGEPFKTATETWYPVVEVDGRPVIGWMATRFNNEDLAFVTVNTPPVDPSAPINVTVTFEIDGYVPATVRVNLVPKT